MVRFKQNYLGAGLLKLMVSFRRDPEYRACIDRSAYGSGLQQAMVCLWQWSASDDDPLQTMDHWMAVVRLITRSANGTGSLQAMVSGRSLLMTMVNLRQWSKAMVI